MGIDLTSLENAIAQLKSALDSYNDDIIQNNPVYKKQVRGAAIQAFEFTYEIAFKMIVRYLEAVSQDNVNANIMSFNSIIREAYKKNIVRSELTVWKQYRQKRCITGHTYNDNKAQDVFSIIPGFLNEMQYVISRLQELDKSLD